MATPILKQGATGEQVTRLQRALRARGKGRVADWDIAVDGILGRLTWDLWRRVVTALGGHAFEGTDALARRRYAIVVNPAGRTAAELRRARAWRRAHKNETATSAGDRPKIVRLNVTIRDLFGPLGPLVGTVGHYTAGPRDTSDSHALALWRQYHAQHAAQGWGGIGYHLGITTAGTLALLRPVALKGAHVGGHNTGRIGVVVHGTTGQRMTAAQRATWRWLLANAHTTAMPASHRAPRRLRDLTVWGHNDLFPTSCPGAFETDYKAA
ncbi:hypothetical protein PAI11_37730 [Patulibacter medicamentivorans]|uniref:N-acetylmuramoyl-L-alanine amidase domain-containing protein n=1 Tax=Patulibacter medicamentivorans TaxID=1097667 RepID=H0EA99_9ACTN|nr:N-acetylmuramoyl-L-alanine amidase [Patulibacter medicamentivorans]EHN09439.1 hypothetical protein PAI11_37730 [Patulibacter medicamentivorans]